MQVNKQVNEEILVLKRHSNTKMFFSSLNVLHKLKYSLFAGILGVGIIFLSTCVSNYYRSYSKIGVIKIDCVRFKNDGVDCKIFRSGDSSFPQNNLMEIQRILAIDLYKNRTKSLIRFGIRFTVSKQFKEDNIFIYDFNSQDESEKAFEFINNFLRSNEPSLTVSYDRYGLGNNFSFYLFLILFLLGLFLLASAITSPFYYEELLLDKLETQLIYKHRIVFDEKIKQYAFIDITKIDLLQAPPDKNDRISFIPRITIDREYEIRLGNIKDRQIAVEFVDNLKKFIGLC
ncbi:MAG: hypothetical protein DCF19_22440 [Pseudanabaena frigida]|uniref:Uncharacterized protein n=1 Tax=Pseudanabaena frigida TaxID=945775 RepID=A0A2W4W200_9CYAN|nr:MAG: hypothetical protein DCF19_22440 [Pseudanabaena frigida]